MGGVVRFSIHICAQQQRNNGEEQRFGLVKGTKKEQQRINKGPTKEQQRNNQEQSEKKQKQPGTTENNDGLV